jgi:acetyltransferase
LSPQTVEQLNAFWPEHWSRNNPVDILGDAGPERYAKALEIAAADPNSDGLLVILTPQDMTDPTQTAEALKKYAKIDGKPVIASWMGGPDVESGVEVLNRANIPTFAYPDRAAAAFNYMWRYSYNLRGIYETPAMAAEGDGFAGATEAGWRIVEGVRAEGRTLLDEVESKRLLAAYGIPTTPMEIAPDVDSAKLLAEVVGFPVVLKIHSKTITHKTDVGGVKLNLKDAAEVARAFAEIRESVGKRVGIEHFHGVTVQPMVKLKDAYEIIVGASPDPQFGPVLLFGSGGQLVEVYKDRALALPPLNATLARRTMEQTKIYSALRGVRGRAPVDVGALEQLLVRFSRLVVEQRWVREIDINPLLASPEGLVALDARVVVYGREVTEDQIPKLAIRPYPTQYVTRFATKDGRELEIRPIRPEDEPLLVKFHQTLSERSVRFRYFSAMKFDQRVSHERLLRVCFNDYDREMALVAEHRDEKTGEAEIVAVGRLSKIPGLDEAEFAILVSDLWQNRGLGKQLLGMILQVARDEKVLRVTADILPENMEMQRLSAKLGFTLQRNLEEGTVRAAIAL